MTAKIKNGMSASLHRLLGLVNKIKAIEFSGGTAVGTRYFSRHDALMLIKQIIEFRKY